ncbi:MAG: extracellular solute-binding protein [Clostridia bacterium]|nr:extracellular solute-binding protein [Clostridia bacterium]
MKKLLSVVLAAIMVFGIVFTLTSCGEDPGVEPTRKEGYYPNITLTLSNLSYVQYTPTLQAMGWTIIDNPVYDLIKKELGIRFKLDIDVEDIEVYFDKLSAGIAAGNLADIACLGDDVFGIPNLKECEKNGLLADLTPYYDGTADVTFTDEVFEHFERGGEDVFYPGTFDGKIKTIPWLTDSLGSTYGFLYFREDWLDEANMSVPTTLDELTDVMRAFKNRGDGCYGLVMGTGFMAPGENHCGVWDMFRAYPFEWLENDKGELYLGATDLGPMKAALQTLQSWYNEGLINSSEDNDIDVIGGLHYYSAEFWNGKAGVFSGSTSMGFISNTIKKNPDAKIVTTPLFAVDGGTVGIAAENNAFIFYGVNAKCKYPEAAVKLYNYYFDINGDSDYIEYFTPPVYKDDKGEDTEGWAPIQFYPLRTYFFTDVDAAKAQLEDYRTGNVDHFTEAQKKAYEKYLDAVENTTYKNYWTVQQYKEGGVLDQYYELIETAEFVRTKFFTGQTPAMEQYGRELEPNLINAAIDIIKGKQTVDYWDTAVDAWFDGGGREITAEVNEWWQGVKGK